MAPRMFIVAGPPGAGKSTAFSASGFGVDFFNADDRAASARLARFTSEMRYLALRNFAAHVERIRMRADAGGHSAPESVLRSIYELSVRNLSRAIREMDYVYVYDNSSWGVTPTVLLQSEKAEIVYLADDIPTWLEAALEKL